MSDEHPIAEFRRRSMHLLKNVELGTYIHFGLAMVYGGDDKIHVWYDGVCLYAVDELTDPEHFTSIRDDVLPLLRQAMILDDLADV